ncbi:Phosphomevalonate kinase, partial [Globisporangium splendens]
MASSNGDGVCVSAPGKVLITGGYLVLDAQYSGLVLASTARFYTRICSVKTEAAVSVNSSDGIDVRIESPQFGQVVCGTLHRDGKSGINQFVVSETSDRNAYIEETLVCAMNGIAGVAPHSIASKAHALHEAASRVRVVLEADNDFYSQVKRLQAANQTLHRRNLASLPKFLPPHMQEQPNGDKVAMKTGLGSSAALVTSLVGALVHYFLPAETTQPESLKDEDQRLELIHNLAQLSHCFVQRKVNDLVIACSMLRQTIGAYLLVCAQIGSGFDVSAACFGSQCYTRFPSSILDAFTSPEALQPEEIKQCITDRAKWDIANRVKQFELPSGFRLFMGDVTAGSHTVSMVRKVSTLCHVIAEGTIKMVLAWQKSQPEQAARVITSLNQYNSEVEQGFTKLHELFAEGDSQIERDCRQMVNCMFEQVHFRESNPWKELNPVLGSVLTSIRESFLMVRHYLREMGELALVPIEPPEQTELVDATMAIPGVLIAGVPGDPRSTMTTLNLKRKQRDGDDEDARDCAQTSALKRSVPCKNAGDVADDPQAESAAQNDHRHAQHEQEEEDELKSNLIPPLKKATETAVTDFSIDKLRFGSESWQGMKPTNEDRAFADATARFPGPAFGVLDGHGGVFTVDFLVRNLLKTMSSSLKQHIRGADQNVLSDMREVAHAELARRREIETQLKLFQEQLDQVRQLMAIEADTNNSDSNKDSDSSGDKDVHALHEQLQSTVRAMEAGIAQIDADDAQRKHEFQKWCHTQDANFKRAFTDAFQRCDAQVLLKNPSRDGSTALLLWFIAGGPLSSEMAYYTINLGDCRAVLCRGGHGIPLTTDHKPDRPDEKQRIQRKGGFVGTFAGIPRVYSATGAGLSVEQQARVTTYLAVSRAFGDRPLKEPTALVSCEPEIKRFTVEQDDLFIVLACDGIWDVMSNQDAVVIGLQHFEDPQKAADAIVKEAYRRGSSDNLTATVIQFGWQEDATTKAKQALAQAKTAAAGKSKAPVPRVLGGNPWLAAIVADSEATGETTENQEDDDDEEEEEIDMFNL